MDKLPRPLEHLRSLVEIHNMSNMRFAAIIGMQRSHFSEIMTGKRRMPLGAIRACIKLGAVPEIMIQPFPCERLPLPPKEG